MENAEVKLFPQALDFCIHSSLSCSCYWQVALLSLSLNTAEPAGWAAFPSVFRYKNCQQTCDYKAKTQSPFMVAAQQKILKLLKGSSLQPYMDHSPASSSKTQIGANLLCMHCHCLHTSWMYPWAFTPFWRKLTVCVCSYHLLPSNRAQLKVGR